MYLEVRGTCIKQLRAYLLKYFVNKNTFIIKTLDRVEEIVLKLQ